MLPKKFTTRQFGIKNKINTVNADINGDNRINTADLAMLKKLILDI